MSSSERRFRPEEPLIPGRAQERCRAVVVVPARNEEASLTATLDALAGQRDLQGRTLDPLSFEVLLLLNNCTDGSAELAHAWQARHGGMALHIVEKSVPPDHAHVGTARRRLMDTAWARLQQSPQRPAILSTDCDTIVAPDWIAQNLRALHRGADAVGGRIELKSGELERLPGGAQTAYRHDREYQQLVAELQDLLDPQAGDPWPRHLQHFGASLACAPDTYARAGGLPPVSPLEDLAFVDALERVDARLRHEPAVRVFTSARLDGRAKVGLSWQLRAWQVASEAGEPHRVSCSPWLQHRFRSLRFLRQLHRRGVHADLCSLATPWRQRVRESLAENTTGEFLRRMDCERWIEETYTGPVREAEILGVNRELRAAIAHLRERGVEKAAAGQDALAAKPVIPPSAAAGQSGSGTLDAP